jgi:hypothetical protein
LKGNRPVSQDHNRRWRLLHRAQGQRHRKVGLRKYGLHAVAQASSPIQEPTDVEKTKLARNQLRAIQDEVKFIKVFLDYYEMNGSPNVRNLSIKLIEDRSRIIEHITHLGHDHLKLYIEDRTLNKLTTIAPFLRRAKNSIDDYQKEMAYIGIAKESLCKLLWRIDEGILYLREEDSEARKKRWEEANGESI